MKKYIGIAVFQLSLSVQAEPHDTYVVKHPFIEGAIAHVKENNVGERYIKFYSHTFSGGLILETFHISNFAVIHTNTNYRVEFDYENGHLSLPVVDYPELTELPGYELQNALSQ